MNKITIKKAESVKDLIGKKLIIYPDFDPSKLSKLLPDPIYYERHKEAFLEVISLIYYKVRTDKRYNKHSDFVKIHSREIDSILNTRKRSIVLQALKGSGLIEVNESYEAGKYPKSYRLGKTLRDF